MGANMMKKDEKVKVICLSFVILAIFILSFGKIKAFAYDMMERPMDKRSAIPILMYHHITEDENDILNVSKPKFEEQMKYLKDNKYQVMSLEDIYDHLEKNKPFPDKAVAITFDDGYEDNYTMAYPILKKYECCATIFMVSNFVDKGTGFMTSRQLKELDKNGIRIESHTANHKILNKLSYEEQLKELKESKEDLSKILNRDVKYIAFPNGKSNKDTRKALRETGYEMAVRTHECWATKRNGTYSLNRIIITGKMDQEKFIKRVADPGYYGVARRMRRNIIDKVE